MKYFLSIHLTGRSSRPEVFCKKGVLRFFPKFTGKHLCESLVFNKVVKKRLWHRCFPVNFAKFLRTPFLQNTSERLLLNRGLELLHLGHQVLVKSVTVNYFPGINSKSCCIGYFQVGNSKKLWLFIFLLWGPQSLVK